MEIIGINLAILDWEDWCFISLIFFWGFAKIMMIKENKQPNE